MNKYEKATAVLKDQTKYSMKDRTDSIELAIKTMEKLSKMSLLWWLFR